MLSFDVPKDVVDRLNLTSLNVYANVANLHTFTDYPGYDPESSTSGDNVVNAGIDYLNYPLPRTYTIGFKFSHFLRITHLSVVTSIYRND